VNSGFRRMLRLTFVAQLERHLGQVRGSQSQPVLRGGVARRFLGFGGKFCDPTLERGAILAIASGFESGRRREQSRQEESGNHIYY
jgi:hypothetical protein